MNKSPLLVKITYILVSASHAKCWPFKYWWSALSCKACKKMWFRPWWRSYTRAHACVCMCVHACAHGLCACTLHAKSGLPTKSRHTRCLLLVLASDLDSSSWNFGTHSIMIVKHKNNFWYFLHNLYKNWIFIYTPDNSIWSTKFFSPIPWENISFYVTENEKKKQQIVFWTVRCVFSCWVAWTALTK